ncbi:ArsR family transcriptional regulator [Sphingobacterium multivorum]|uniref:ArsR family transcriptional regulator n=1 Tax=Sphingobacterium multivorum TaxID=28454 RepID=UPI003DA5E860
MLETLITSKTRLKLLIKFFVSATNRAHSLFKPLQHLIHTFLVIDQLVEQVLDQAGDIHEVNLLGDYAKGLDNGAIEVHILGERINEAYLLLLAERIGKHLGKMVCIYFNKAYSEQKIKLYLNTDLIN